MCVARLTLPPLLRRICRAQSGLAAVEFALILPILVTIWIGGVEITQGLSVDRRLNNLAAAIGDLVSRSRTVTYSDVEAIFDIDDGALYPYSTTSLSMRVTAVNVDETKKAVVVWSQARGPAGTRPAGQNLDTLIDEKLRLPKSQIIMAEVFYTYAPAVGYVITGNIALDDRLYFTPRQVQYIQLCNDTKTTCQS